MNLLIARGIPGTGKTTRVKKVAAEIENGVLPSGLELFFQNKPQKLSGPVSIFSADHFYGEGEEYKKNWSREKAHLGHRDCEAKVLTAMKAGTKSIIVDNTNLSLQGFRIYLDYALDHGYAVYFIYPDSPWWVETVEPFLRVKQVDDESKARAAEIAKILYEKNVHGVPEATLVDMLMKFQWVTFDEYVVATQQRAEVLYKEVAYMRRLVSLLESNSIAKVDKMLGVPTEGWIFPNE